MPQDPSPALVSIIIPVHNGATTLPRCLRALCDTTYPHRECLVVDDGSTDGSAAIAREYGVCVISETAAPCGPAAARNRGARQARGEILFFLDADVVVQPDTVGRMARVLGQDEQVAACFGSYDTSPAADNFLSQYKNLQHHYVHQQGKAEADTFWAGCGAIRRAIFLEMGGFDARYRRPSVEDIELGYRLREAGHRIRLEKSIQVRHLKRWTPVSHLRSEILARAVPWSHLLAGRKRLVGDLNLAPEQRLSALVAWLALGSAFLAPASAGGAILAVALAAVLPVLNRHFYRFLLQERGLRFTLAALPWHWLYFLYSSAALALVLFAHAFRCLAGSEAGGLGSANRPEEA